MGHHPYRKNRDTFVLPEWQNLLCLCANADMFQYTVTYAFLFDGNIHGIILFLRLLEMTQMHLIKYNSIYKFICHPYALSLPRCDDGNIVFFIYFFDYVN